MIPVRWPKCSVKLDARYADRLGNIAGNSSLTSTCQSVDDDGAKPEDTTQKGGRVSDFYGELSVLRHDANFDRRLHT